jgi:serine/threonine-protein kinase
MAKVVAEPGTIIGEKYRLVRVIGTGGMGVVYEARHIELGQRVALKLLQSGDDDEQLQRFFREARASARLRSEHAAKVVDVGRQKSGAPFMVMELLSGKDLGEICKARPLPPPLAVSYVLQACEAVAEAHARGIVHRDLKPSNLFLTERADGQPLVKVLDFGIAKMMRADSEGKLTGTGAVMGSPQYMSPEQLRSSRDVDHRTDIWSLGVCLYELLSGRAPFEADAVPELYVMVLRDKPAPIQARVPSLAPALAAAIMRCLEKDPAARWATVYELANALEPFGLDAARGSAARISTLLSKTGRSEPPPALEEAVLTAAAMSLDPTVAISRSERSGSPRWIVASVFAATAIIGIGAGAAYLRKQPAAERTPTPVQSAEPTPTPSETAAAPVVSAPASVASAAPSTPSAPTPRPLTAIRPVSAPKPPENAVPNAVPSAKPRPAPASELKTTFE